MRLLLQILLITECAMADDFGIVGTIFFIEEESFQETAYPSTVDSMAVGGKPSPLSIVLTY